MSEIWPWASLFLLGAYHGINPGMGWLFAVALGLQEKSRGAVLRALPPIAAGHGISIAAVAIPLLLFQRSLPGTALRVGAAAALIAFGLYRLLRSRHPRWVGMQVGFRDLTVWSFLMATAHGAGLMLLPVLLGWPHGEHQHAGGQHASSLPLMEQAGLAPVGAWLGPVAVHTAGYLLVAAFVAFIVYEKLGLSILRRAWFNLDRLWALALIASGILTLLI